MIPHKPPIVLLSSLLIAGLGFGAEGHPQAATSTQPPSHGARLFQIYCQSCHGPHGAGDGPVADELQLSIPDLRTLARRSPDHSFPATRVAAIIDGREAASGHGTREMPVWGLTFREPGKVADQESEVELRIAALVAHLRALQVP